MSEIVTSKYETPTIVTEGEFFDFNASVPLKAEYAVLLMDLLPTLIPNATVHQLLGLTRFAIYLRGHQLGVANKRILEAINLHFPAKLTENTSLEALNQAKPAGDFLKLTDSLVVGQLRQSLLSGQRFGRRTWKGPFIPLDLYTAALPNIYFINHWDRLVGVVSQFLGEQFDNVLLLNLIMVTQSGLIKERLINRTLVSAIRAANIEQAHLLVGRPTEEIPAETLFNQMCQELALGYQYLLQARELLNFHVRRLGSQYLKTNKAALTDPSLSEYQSNPTDLAHYLLDLIKAVIFIKTTQLTQEQQRMVGNQYQEVVMAVGSADLARAKQLIIDLMIALGDSRVFTDQTFTTLGLSINELEKLVSQQRAEKEAKAQAAKQEQLALQIAQSRKDADNTIAKIALDNDPQVIEQAKTNAGKVYLAYTNIGTLNKPRYDLRLYMVSSNPIKFYKTISVINHVGIKVNESYLCTGFSVRVISIDERGSLKSKSQSTARWSTTTLIKNATSPDYICVGTVAEIKQAISDHTLSEKLSSAISQVMGNSGS